MLLIIAILVLFFFLKCNRTDSTVKLKALRIAHRGGYKGLAVENSIESIQSFIADKNLDCTEIDIQLTNDKKFILFHDTNFHRLGKSLKTVASCDYSQIKKITLTQDKFTSKTALIDEALELILKSSKNVIIDIKVKSNIKSIYSEFSDILSNEQIRSRVIITSFNPMIIYLLKKKFDSLNVGLSVDADGRRFKGLLYSLFMLRIIILQNFLGLNFLLINKNLISTRLIEIIKGWSVEPIAWTVNKKNEQDWFESKKCLYLANSLKGECVDDPSDF